MKSDPRIATALALAEQRGHPFYAAEIGARWEDTKRPKPKKAKKVAPGVVQEAMQL